MPFIYAKTHQDNMKSLPSLEFISQIVDICQKHKQSDTLNYYDRKNHTLFINDSDSFEKNLMDNYKRTFSRFQKQLKMIGFRKKKIVNQYNDQTIIKKIDGTNSQMQTENNIQNKKQQQIQSNQQENKFMYVWKSNKNKLLQRQLQEFEEHLSKQICKAIQLKQNISVQNKNIDRKLQNLLFKCFIQQDLQANYYEETDQEQKRIEFEKEMKQNVERLKQTNNNFQIEQRDLVKELSGQLGKQLQIYRLLIYKDNQIKNKK